MIYIELKYNFVREFRIIEEDSNLSKNRLIIWCKIQKNPFLQ